MAMGSFYRVGSGLQLLRLVKPSVSFTSVPMEGPAKLSIGHGRTGRLGVADCGD